MPMKTIAMADNGHWRTMAWVEKGTWWMVLYYRGRVYKAKKFPTMESALSWARDLMNRVDRGIESDPV